MNSTDTRNGPEWFFDVNLVVKDFQVPFLFEADSNNVPGVQDEEMSQFSTCLDLHTLDVFSNEASSSGTHEEPSICVLF
jgi:hypothetical protein